MDDGAGDTMLGLRVRADALDDLPFDAESARRLDREIERRHRAQRTGRYALTLERPDLGPGVRVHLGVVGLPEYDAAGALAGSPGFTEDRTLPRAEPATGAPGAPDVAGKRQNGACDPVTL